jgi:hypothetical protein
MDFSKCDIGKLIGRYSLSKHCGNVAEVPAIGNRSHWTPPLGAGYRKNKHPFSSKGKVLLDERVVKHARPRSKIGDFSDHSSALGAKFRGVLASRASTDQGGQSAQGAEPDRIGYQFGITGIAQICVTTHAKGSGSTDQLSVKNIFA